MAAPTFVSENESVWNTTADKTIAPSVQSGDVLVAMGALEGWTHAGDNVTVSGTHTWTEQQSHRTTSNCCLVGATAVSGSTTSGDVVVADGAAGDIWSGGNILVFRDSDGVGTSVKAQSSGTATVSITTTEANSAIVVFVADWNAIDGASRTWATVNSITPTSGNGYEVTYFRDGARYTVYGAYYPDAGAAGSKTVGISSPGGQAYGIIAIEVLGSAGGGSTSHIYAAYSSMLGAN